MNWIKENKFLAGFLAALVVGAGFLAFLLITNQGKFTEVSDNYSKQAEELKRLQNLVPYPDEANLKLMREQKDEYVANIGKLEKELATAHQFSLEPMQPSEFQDLLKKTVDAVIEKSGTGVLPQKFYLGFDVYQTKPPGGEAAAPLARELKAIDLVVNTLIDAKVTSITDIKRPPLPEETDPKAAATQKKLVRKTPFDITFVADQGRMRKALDDIVGSKKQFFILRALIVKNEKEKGPARADASAPSTSGTTDETQRIKIIVGTEKLIVTARIEIVDFALPSTK
ncbi:MAG: Amuc_1100 family pilus-like protein [Verrucomicrobiota bacterium]